MKYYLAPLEGLTTYVYRNAYHRIFHSMDKYFTPFIVPHRNRGFKEKELKEILPENNKGLYLVPQILTDDAKDFVRTAHEFKAYGYEEVNLNAGCPSGTVVPKGKGAGMLADTYRLEKFLDEVFEKIDGKVSVKTRLGMQDAEEFGEILEVYNKFPLEELIIHARIREDYYKNKPHLEVFAEALENSRNSVCYNGDLFSGEDYEQFVQQFPSVSAVMLGRGMMSNPGLLDEICDGKQLDKARLRMFHDEIYEENRKLMSGDRAVLFRMKELWAFMISVFEDNTKYAKRIKKAEKAKAYEMVVDELFYTQKLKVKGVRM